MVKEEANNKMLCFHHNLHNAMITDNFLTTQEGIKAVKWSFAGLMLTAVFQVIVFVFTGSVSLLADTVHNFLDAFTSVPLWIAFEFQRLKSTRRFTYGYGRIEDMAGVVIVFMIGLSALYVGYESVMRVFNPTNITHIWAVMIASLVGFAGNELVALYRIKVGKRIGSVALVVDGYHARADGLTSLAVFVGAIGVLSGFTIADPLIGIIITIVIIKIGVGAGKEVFTRLLDGVDPRIVEEIRNVSNQTKGVQNVTEVRARWLGHKLYAEVNISVNPDITIEQGHIIAKETIHHLFHHFNCLGGVTVHIDPVSEEGEKHHKISEQCTYT